MAVTLEELQRIMPHAGDRAAVFLDPLNEAMQEFEINTFPRQAAFLAQLAHESGSLRYVRELASGTDYEGRKDLGNTQAGDGPRFKGRGLIQLTGRANYAEASDYFGVDFVFAPEMLETPEWAARTAAWFWWKTGLNELADRGDFKLITKRINGGYNHYAERVAYYERAMETLS